MKTKAKALAVLITLTSIVSFSCSKSVSVNSSADVKTYNSTGVIREIDINGPKVTIDHQDIPGYMSAMEMTFPAVNPSVFAGIAVGDKVAFVLERSKGKVILTQISKLAGAATTNAVSGPELFAANCAKCHGDKGEGTKKGIPLISGHALAHTEEEYVQQVNKGTANKMPAFKDKLSPDEIAAVVKYLRTEIQSGIKPEQREHHH